MGHLNKVWLQAAAINIWPETSHYILTAQLKRHTSFCEKFRIWATKIFQDLTAEMKAKMKKGLVKYKNWQDELDILSVQNCNHDYTHFIPP